MLPSAIAYIIHEGDQAFMCVLDHHDKEFRRYKMNEAALLRLIAEAGCEVVRQKNIWTHPTRPCLEKEKCGLAEVAEAIVRKEAELESKG